MTLTSLDMFLSKGDELEITVRRSGTDNSNWPIHVYLNADGFEETLFLNEEHVEKIVEVLSEFLRGG